MTRKKRLPLFALSLAAWLLFSLWALSHALDDFFDRNDLDTRLSCADCRTLEVVRVIDGDTFVGPDEVRVRLYGVNTPERGEPCFDEATERLRELAGGEVRVEQGPRQVDDFERLLYYVYTERGESIDALVVREGFGFAWRQDGQHRDLIVALEEEARAEGTGCLW